MNLHGFATTLCCSATALMAMGCIELTTTSGGGGAGGSGAVSSSSSTGGSSSASSSGGGAACNMPTNDCNSCEVCSGESPTGMCNAEYLACLNSPACSAIDNCMHACPKGELSCWEGCMMMNETGTDTYFEYYFCVYCGDCVLPCQDSIPCAG